jgi:hypothetical protein
MPIYCILLNDKISYDCMLYPLSRMRVFVTIINNIVYVINKAIDKKRGTTYHQPRPCKKSIFAWKPTKVMEIL